MQVVLLYAKTTVGLGYSFMIPWPSHDLAILKKLSNKLVHFNRIVSFMAILMISSCNQDYHP